MAITLTVQVQDMRHGIVRTIVEPSHEPFLKVCRAFEASGVRYVDFIWPYQDAMLNEFQLLAWLEDFPAALGTVDLMESERGSAERLLAAAREAVELSGYLFFEG